ncbi:MAG: alpha/beta hydrolase [Bacteroidetes bacterium]|nr:alpha/beta hydrolase [Bacteroidota bacterium]
MNWKLRLVLFFTNFNNPTEGEGISVPAWRRKANMSARLGALLYDRKTPVTFVQDATADGVPIRIYRNSTAAAQRVVIYYHGGGFALYGLDSHDYVCRRICAMNDCVVISVDYRLAPEHFFPAAHEDAFTAIKWVRAHIANYNGDPDNLVVMGDSAGGNLAACMAHKCKKEGIPLRAQVLVYPWIDGKLQHPSMQRNGKGYMLTAHAVRWFQQQYTPDPALYCVPEVSPCYEAEHTGLAPAFILTAEFDPLLDDGRYYYEQLKAAGNKATYKEYKGLIHGFFNIPRVAPQGMEAFRDIRDFLKTV